MVRTHMCGAATAAKFSTLASAREQPCKPVTLSGSCQFNHIDRTPRTPCEGWKQTCGRPTCDILKQLARRLKPHNRQYAPGMLLIPIAFISLSTRPLLSRCHPDWPPLVWKGARASARMARLPIHRSLLIGAGGKLQLPGPAAADGGRRAGNAGEHGGQPAHRRA